MTDQLTQWYIYPVPSQQISSVQVETRFFPKFRRRSRANCCSRLEDAPNCLRFQGARPLFRFCLSVCIRFCIIQFKTRNFGNLIHHCLRQNRRDLFQFSNVSSYSTMGRQHYANLSGMPIHAFYRDSCSPFPSNGVTFYQQTDASFFNFFMIPTLSIQLTALRFQLRSAFKAIIAHQRQTHGKVQIGLLKMKKL